jgi:hypothetical protein
MQIEDMEVEESMDAKAGLRGDDFACIDMYKLSQSGGWLNKSNYTGLASSV